MQTGPKRNGRPRGFDRDAAVATAMRLFRQHGYEGVSLAMLTDAIGIAPPSLYAAFGSKAGLYREALDRYTAQASLTLVPEDAPDLTLDEALRQMLERAIMLVAGQSGERGCMISTGLLATHPDHHDLAEELVARRHAMSHRLSEELERWFPLGRSGNAARFLCTVLQGIAVRARDGTDVDTLRAIAAMARSAIKRELEEVSCQ